MSRLSYSVYALVFLASASTPSEVPIGERPSIESHLDQKDIEAQTVSLGGIIEHGRHIFNARFNELDGQGRPANTGGGQHRDARNQPAFIRTSGPDANSCFGCHNQPASGGSGDFVANVFVLSQLLDPVTDSLSPDFSNERNTLGMFGSGAIETLAREMTDDLQEIRTRAMTAASRAGTEVTLPLYTKGVSFGSITVTPSGLVDPSKIEGIDWDLIVKPFHQKGAVVSLREFTNNAMNHHHGMQSVERFGPGVDYDEDGITDELSIGDITAVSVFQATLPVPQQRFSKNPERRHAAKLGKAYFGKIGCTVCHVPILKLRSRFFIEPNPYNPAGDLQTSEVKQVLTWDMTTEGQQGPKLERHGDGAIVRAYTDLKRHNLCDKDFQHYCNERLHQGNLLGFADPEDFTATAPPRPTGAFLTRKLWDVASSSPYGHRGDLTSITQAIHHHGGEARRARDRFFSLDDTHRAQIIEFLKTLDQRD